MHNKTVTSPWLFVGTIPEADSPLTLSPFSVTGGALCFGPQRCPVNRGTPAMLAAASIAHARLSPEAGSSGDGLHALATGDTGKGEGSRQVYRKLNEILP